MKPYFNGSLGTKQMSEMHCGYILMGIIFVEVQIHWKRIVRLHQLNLTQWVTFFIEF